MPEPSRAKDASFAARVACRALGHVFRFTADGAVMSWSCERGCGTGGERPYATAEEAARYASAFDVDHRSELGRDAPPLGMFPLRVAWWLKQRRQHLTTRRRDGAGGSR